MIAVERHLDGTLAVEPAPAGMHLLASLAPALAKRMMGLLRKLAATLQETTLPANETGGL